VKKRVLIFGTFDHFHPGHEFVVRSALERGSVTAVVARDATVERIKGKRPRQGEPERMRVIRERFEGLTVILGDAKDFLAPVRDVRPDLILLGYDQQLPPGITEKDLGADIERLPAYEPQKFKSSLMRQK
jgi:FAD synthetase